MRCLPQFLLISGEIVWKAVKDFLKNITVYFLLLSYITGVGGWGGDVIKHAISLFKQELLESFDLNPIKVNHFVTNINR